MLGARLALGVSGGRRQWQLWAARLLWQQQRCNSTGSLKETGEAAEVGGRPRTPSSVPGVPFQQRPLPLPLPLALPVQTTVLSDQHLGPSSGHCRPQGLLASWSWGGQPGADPHPGSVIHALLGPGLGLLFLRRLWRSQAAAAELSIPTEPTWPAKPDIFTSRSFTGKVCFTGEDF